MNCIKFMIIFYTIAIMASPMHAMKKRTLEVFEGENHLISQPLISNRLSNSILGHENIFTTEKNAAIKSAKPLKLHFCTPLASILGSNKLLFSVNDPENNNFYEGLYESRGLKEKSETFKLYEKRFTCIESRDHLTKVLTPVKSSTAISQKCYAILATYDTNVRNRLLNLSKSNKKIRTIL